MYFVMLLLFFFICLFFDCTGSLLLGLSLVVVSRGYSLVVVLIMVRSSLWLLIMVACLAVVWALGFMSFSDCGIWAL